MTAMRNRGKETTNIVPATTGFYVINVVDTHMDDAGTMSLLTFKEPVVAWLITVHASDDYYCTYAAPITPTLNDDDSVAILCPDGSVITDRGDTFFTNIEEFLLGCRK